MSDHDSWLAVRGPSKAELLDMLGLEETGEIGWNREVARPYAYASVPSGWTIIFANFNGLADIENIRDLSRHGMVLACDFQDQVDAPSAILIAARDGAKLWEIGVVGDEITETGTAPPELEPIRDRYAVQLAEDPGCAWMYEVPLELAKALCGFRHDEDDSPFRGLRPQPDSRWHRDLKSADHPESRVTSEPSSWKGISESARLIASITIIIVLIVLMIGDFGGS
ncbi:MAG: hypothetical protein EOP61_14955 [Sphingomonadales bacterium]|nr:MAG: hypothetical protein EOP61_14955 [Sphingomonadales bacterium]